jgi:hypothetical protein
MPSVVLKRIGVLSSARVQAVFGCFFGLVFAALQFLILISTSAGPATRAGASQSKAVPDELATALGSLMLIIGPLSGLVVGFLWGAINALIYNLVFGGSGGIEMELQDRSSGC